MAKLWIKLHGAYHNFFIFRNLKGIQLLIYCFINANNSLFWFSDFKISCQ